MMSSIYLLVLSISQPLPDQSDVLRTEEVAPQIQLLLDSSCSMGWDPEPTVCNHYAETRTAAHPLLSESFLAPDGTWHLTRLDQLKATLTGCRSPQDGILDVWTDRAVFAIRQFGHVTDLLPGAGFDNQLPQGTPPGSPQPANLLDFENAIFGLHPFGGTPLASAYQRAALYFDNFFSNANSTICQQNYIVIMSDGESNGPASVPFVHIPEQPDLFVRDSRNCFNNYRFGCPLPPYPDEAAAYLYQNSSFLPVDALSHVDGVQPIRTYTIGFQASTQANALLGAMAHQGGGLSYDANNFDQLTTAFQDIVTNIISRANVSFASGQIQNEGLFSGNHVYIQSFRPMQTGLWRGTTKKHCIIPSSSADTECIYLGSPEDLDSLTHNPRPVDLWTNVNTPEATVGGTGQVMLETLFDVSLQRLTIPSRALSRRTILTWRPGQFGYVSVHPYELELSDSWSSTFCEHLGLIQELHGFASDRQACAASIFSPLAFDIWPIGDSINSGSILLKYTPNCSTELDRCYVVNAANDGMLHFYNAITGVETAAIIPAELWRPNPIAKHILHSRSDQPTITTSHRYYYDGEIKLHHEDNNANGYIDEGEIAKLITGLGRAGSAYYLFDVSTFDGVPNNEHNPVQPLFTDESTSFKHLKETWSAPWTGFMRIDNDSYRVAVFATGHVPEWDNPQVTVPSAIALKRQKTEDSEQNPFSVTCADMGISPAHCATPQPEHMCTLLDIECPVTGCRPCNSPNIAECIENDLAPPYCYDWPGFSAMPRTGQIEELWHNPPHNILTNPISFEQNGRRGKAYRIHFAEVDLQPSDSLSIENNRGEELVRISGRHESFTTPWLYVDSFQLNFTSDGINDESARGYRISHIDVIRTGAHPSSLNTSHPSIYFVDLQKWNGPDIVTADEPTETVSQFFSSPPGPNEHTQASSILYRFTSLCSDTETRGPDEACIDQHTTENTEDLRFMTCPISASPAAYTVGGYLRSIYIGDECGQIWRIKHRNGRRWKIKRLLATNNTNNNHEVVRGLSKDVRKIFTQLDLVISTCPGRRAIGVYFGTGNVQRPTAIDALQDPSVTRHEGSIRSTNVIGVVWDHPGLPRNATLSNLRNVTNHQREERLRRSPNGYYIELLEHERLLRKPLVFAGTFYADVFRPDLDRSLCGAQSGISRTLAMHSCTTRPIVEPPVDAPFRTISERINPTLGGGFSLITPLHAKPMITLGSDVRGSAILPRRRRFKKLRLLLWRL